MAAKTLRRLELPAPVPFQFPMLKDKPPEGPNWLYEFKLDGYRLQLASERTRVRISTRNGHDYTDRFPALTAVAGELGDCILDGEIVALGKDGLPDFRALESAVASRKTDHLVYFAFDCLFAGGVDLRPFALSVRKHKLRELLDQAGEHVSEIIRYVEAVPGPGKALFQAAKALKIEGLVAKRLDAPYIAGKHDKWVKIKYRASQDVVVGGWRQNGPTLVSLYTGVPVPGGGLRFIGQVGTGFSAASMQMLMPALKAAQTDVSPFADGAIIAERSGEVRWVRPEVVIEIEVGDSNAAGKLRQASFKRLRPDKSAAEGSWSA